jgi:type IV pilus assembly protein PilX
MKMHSQSKPLPNARGPDPGRRARGMTGPARQRGVSLFIVVVVLLLSLIAVLGGLTMTNLNESLVGNQSDQQRAYAAAEALINSAQRDIRLNNGVYCSAGGLAGAGTNLSLQGANAAPPNCTVRYPADLDDFMEMVNNVAVIGGINKCSGGSTFKGVCISNSPDADGFLSSKVNNDGAQLLSNGAGYNQFTSSLGSLNWGEGAQAGEASLALGTGSDAQNFKGAYWVEIFPYHTLSGAMGGGMPANVPVPDSSYPFIFRITALAQGMRGGTVSVLRTYYVPYPCKPSAAVGGGCG